MATNQFTGLLQQFGLPAVSEEEMLAARTKQRLEQIGASARESRQFGPRKEQDFRYFGRLIGGALGVKLNPSKLTPEEAKQHEAVATAQSNYEAAVAQNPLLASDPVDAELTYQKKLAEALIETGQYDKAIPMFAQIEQKRRAYRKQKMELEKLGIDITGAETRNEATAFALEQAQRGEFATVYPKDSWNENSGVDMYIDPDTGDAVTYNADGDVVARMDAGTFTTARPKSPKTTGAGGKPLTLQQRGVSPSEAKELRNNVAAAREQMKGAMKIRDILEEAANAGTEGINVLGAQGNLTTGFVRFIDTLSGVSRQIGGSITLTNGTAEGGDLATESSARKYFRDNKDSLEKELAQFVPPNIREDSVLAERFYAAMIRLTNARMKAVEPGARQLSDEDFRRALKETAGATTNPEAFRHIMLGNVLSSARAAKDRIDFLPPSINFTEIVNPGEYQTFLGELGDFEAAFANPFGTNAAPGPGLTGRGSAVGDISDIDAYYGTKED